MLRLIFRLFGPFPALIFGDTLVLDRWLWLRKQLPRVRGQAVLVDVGCGSGTFTNAAARRGYRATGVSFNAAQNERARRRADWTNVSSTFIDHDIRALSDLSALQGMADVVICTETIEHILNDRKLMIDIAGCLKPGGRLLMTAPYEHYKAITPEDDGPFSTFEDGGHVRRGYTAVTYRMLCEGAGLEIKEMAFCSGLTSQWLTKILRKFTVIEYRVGWLAILPLRILPPVLDPIISLTGLWPPYSITLVATKPNI